MYISKWIFIVYVYLRCKANDEYGDAREASEGTHTIRELPVLWIVLAINSLGPLLRDLSARFIRLTLINISLDGLKRNFQSNCPVSRLSWKEILLLRKELLVAIGWTFCATSRAESVYAQRILVYQYFRKGILNTNLRIESKKYKFLRLFFQSAILIYSNMLEYLRN